MGSMAIHVLKTTLKTVGCAVVFVTAVTGIGALVVTQAPKLERKVRNHA